MILLLFGTIFNPHEIKGSRSWIVLGPVSLQPAEFAKFATALALGKYINEYTFQMQRTRNLITVLGIILLPMALIILQKETGSALVYLSFFPDADLAQFPQNNRAIPAHRSCSKPNQRTPEPILLSGNHLR